MPSSVKLDKADSRPDLLVTALPPLALASSIFVVLLHSAIGSFAQPETIAYSVISYLEDTFGRVAVPLFFLVAGFLFYRGAAEGGLRWKAKLRRRVFSLVIPYFLCATLYFIFSLAVSRGNMPGGLSGSEGVFWRWLIAPAPFQLWFVRDLFIFALFAPLWIKAPSILRILLLLIAAFFWIQVKEPLPKVGDYAVFSMEGIFWYFSGAWMALRLSHLPDMLSSLVEKRTLPILWGSGILWLTLGAFVGWQGVQGLDVGGLRSAIPFRSTTVFGVIFCILAALRWGHLVRWGKHGFPFFLYLFHLPLCIYIRRFTEPFVSGELPRYCLAAGLTIASVWIASIFLRRFVPKIYGLLTGGRGS